MTDNNHAFEIADLIATPVAPANFPEHRLRYRNQRWADHVDLGRLSDEDWIGKFAAFEAFSEDWPEPVALAYHGHQFGVYNPQIGDGRGFLYAQLQDDRGRLLDFGTKGSGQTPYSRSGDGRLTLKGGVREVLAANLLEALGVYTSKPFSLIETGEQLYRGDEPSPTRSSVLVRLSHSHMRFGTFQRLATMQDKEGLARLTRYCARIYHPDTFREDDGETATAFLQAVMEATAGMIAGWMAAGFVHGVMNTDNMVVTGESFDYGPWRFLPTFDPNFTAAYFDEGGRYRYGHQPAIGAWNLYRLADCLTGIADVSALEEVLDGYSKIYHRAFQERMMARLGLQPGEIEDDMPFLQALMSWMADSEAGYEQTLFDWFCGPASENRAGNSPQGDLYRQPQFEPIREGLLARQPAHDERLQLNYFKRRQPCTLLVEEVETIWSAIAEQDDWSLLHAKLQDIEGVRQAYGFKPRMWRAAT